MSIEPKNSNSQENQPRNSGHIKLVAGDREEKPSSTGSSVTDSELVYWIALSRIKGVGPRSFQSLLEHFGQPQSVFESSVNEVAGVSGVGKNLAEKIFDQRDLDQAERILSICQKKNIQITTFNDQSYPILLKQIYDPPSLFYQFGDFQSSDQISIAIVGARKATRYGIQTAEMLGRGLARSGVTVVSGLARGIDSAAHRAALEAGGRTIAVLGSGLMNLYPPENTDLARQIGKQGVVISENDLSQPPHSTTFPRRNRIISGLSLGIVVVEAASRSGALITARMAMEQNRDVFAVPGRVDSPLSAGCNDLLADGAILVRNEDDILDAIQSLAKNETNFSASISKEKSAAKSSGTKDTDLRPRLEPKDLTLSEKQVWDSIENEPTSIDQIVESTKLPVQNVLSIVTVLQSKRLLRRISGQLVEK